MWRYRTASRAAHFTSGLTTLEQRVYEKRETEDDEETTDADAGVRGARRKANQQHQAHADANERDAHAAVLAGRPRTAAKASDRRFGDLELRDRLEKAIARLPANYRLLVAAHYLDGVQYEDLADAMQLPLGTVKTQLFRAKQQLRRILETELK